MTAPDIAYLLTENDLRRAYREHASSLDDDSWWADFDTEVQTLVLKYAAALGVSAAPAVFDAVALVRERKAAGPFNAIAFGRHIERRMRSLPD